MALSVKVGGSIKPMTNCKVKVGGAWKQATNILIKDNGVWKPAWSNKYIIYASNGDVQLVPPVQGTDTWKRLKLTNIYLFADYLDSTYSSYTSTLTVGTNNTNGLHNNVIYGTRVLSSATFTIDNATSMLKVEFFKNVSPRYGKNVRLVIETIEAL